MRLDDALDLREFGVELVIVLLMRQPCAWAARCFLPLGHLDLKQRRYEGVNLAGMYAVEQGRVFLVHILRTDIKRSQFSCGGSCCHNFDVVKSLVVAFTIVHNQPLWFYKDNNSNPDLSSRVTT